MLDDWAENEEMIPPAPVRIEGQIAMVSIGLAIAMTVMGLLFGSREVIYSLGALLLKAYVVVEVALCVLFFVVLPLSSAASRQDWAQIWRQIIRDFRWR